MKKAALFFVSLIAGITIFFLVIRAVGWEDIRESFLSFSPYRALVIFIITFLIMVVGNWKWKEILKSKDIDVPFWDLFKIYLAGFSIMFLAPVLFLAGELFRSYGVKKGRSISWPEAASSVIIDRVLEWTINLIIVFFGGLFFLSKIALPPQNLMLIFGGAFLLLLSGISMFYLKLIKKESIAKTFGQVFNGELDSKPLAVEKEVFDFFRLPIRKVVKVFVISSLRAGLVWMRTWLLIIFLEKSISPWSALSVLSFTFLAVMIPIPTALGLHEAIQVFAFKSLGLKTPVATAFTMIIRGADFLTALLGLFIFFRLGLEFIKKIASKNGWR